MRTTHKLVLSKFKRFIKAIDGSIAESYDDVGAYELDYNAVYGGYVINKLCNIKGAITQPFGSTRHKAAAFYDLLDFAELLIHDRKSRSVDTPILALIN